jgi:hypothetical protein
MLYMFSQIRRGRPGPIAQSLLNIAHDFTLDTIDHERAEM